MAHSLGDSVFAGVVGSVLTAAFVSARGRLRLVGMDMSAPIAVGGAVLAADFIGSNYVVQPVLDRLELSSPSAIALSGPAIVGVATYAVLRLGAEQGAEVPWTGPFLVGAVSSYSGPMLKGYLGY